MKTVIPICIIILSTAVVCALAGLPFLDTLEQKTVDLRMRTRPPAAGFGSQVVVIHLDEAVMDMYPCRSPVPRQLLANLIQIVHSAGAKVIALDVFLEDMTVDAADKSLVDAIESAGNVILTSALRSQGDTVTLDLPHDRFLKAALATGLADLPVDPVDQRVRYLKPAFQVKKDLIPSFSTVAWRFMETGSPVLEPRTGDSMARLLKPYSPDRKDRIRINYQGPAANTPGRKNVFQTLPASAVATGLIPKQWLSGKAVLIGAAYEDNTDAYRTPFYSARSDWALMPGVEIHANALSTLLSKTSVRGLSFLPVGLIIFGFSAMVIGVERRLNTFAAGIWVGLLFSGYTIAAFMIFEAYASALPVVPVFCAGLISYISITVFRSLTEGRQKKWIKNAFQKYLSPEFVEILVKNPDRLFLGGLETELTIMFSDLQGFTTLSEGLAPTELVAVLNEYLDGMTNILLEHGGTLDKYEGDAIMAFWGAPVEQSDHVKRSVTAVLAMRRFSEQLNADFQAQGKPGIKTRFGVNTGKAVAGNIGSEKRLNYTIIGDEVNLASRLEGANKQYGTTVMVSHNTYQAVKTDFIFRPLDLLQVKGKNKPVQVYEVLQSADEPADPVTEKMLAFYLDGMTAYAKQDWNTALSMFQKAVEIKPDDGPSLTYIERCRHFEKTPPPGNWDGVYVMKTK